jgi:diguanylate cyclase (GGDEF)-like protein/PAS domain S-box-containing protein
MISELAALSGTYDLHLLVLSLLVAVLMPYAGFEVAERARATRDRVRVSWILLGGPACGAGLFGAIDLVICSLQQPMPVRYHYPTMLAALLAAIFAVTFSMFAATLERESVPRAFIISCLVAIPGTAVPFLCLRSFRMAASLQLRRDLMVASAVLAVFIYLAVVVLDVAVVRSRPLSAWRRVVTSLITGAAIVTWVLGILRTVRFYPNSVVAVAHTWSRSFPKLAAIGGFSVLVLAGTILTATLSRLFSLRNELVAKARKRETFFNNLAEAIPNIVWIADENGQTTYINRHWYEMTGSTPSQAAGSGWMESIHPDDREALTERWGTCVRTGDTLELEYRLHDATRGYRWYLDRALPVRDDKGVISQWFGTCTDIEEQKLYQQNLEQQIKDRTEELAESNVRLQNEMLEKDLARRKLDEETAKMMRSLKRRSGRSALLAKMGELLQSCQTREEVFTAALGFAPKIFPSRRGAIALFDSSRNQLEIAGQWHECQLPVQSFEPDSCWALRTGHPHLVRAGDITARCSHATGITGTFLCVPILAQGEALGILHIQAMDEDPELGEAELSFKTTFAAQTGLSVANIRLRDALRAQSMRDPLTGLYNRRYLTEMLEREIRRAARAEQSLGIMMLDLDHFKKFNDTYGHEAGDAVLRETASFLVRSIRAEDFVCRYGGEEFVVVLPTADLRVAGLRAEAVRSRLRELVVVHQGHSLGMVTASIGVAAVPQHGTTEKDLLQAADAALYRAKKAGRDRVVLGELSTVQDVPKSADAAASAT